MNSWKRLRREISHQLHLSRRRELAVLRGWLCHSPGSLLLDLGCGDGYWTTHLSEAGYACFGIDLNMAEISRASSFYASERLRFTLGNVQFLPFADAKFDRAACLCSLQNFSNSLAALCELARVMAPHGLVGLSVDSLFAPPWVSDEYRRYHTARFSTSRGFDLNQLSEDLHSVGLSPIEHQWLLRSPSAAFWAMQQERFGWSVNWWFPLSIPLSRLFDRLTPLHKPGLILLVLAQRVASDNK